MLYCHGTCGSEWLDKIKGCQRSDADAYCKLKSCGEDSVASSFEVTTATNNPGFACHGLGTDYGDWFGMTGVRFENDIKATHAAGKVVANVACRTSGKYNYLCL